MAEVHGLVLRRTTRATLQRLLADHAGPKDWLFETTWVAQPLPTPSTAAPDGVTNAAAVTGAWILQADPAGVSADVATLLAARGLERSSPFTQVTAGHLKATSGAWILLIRTPGEWLWLKRGGVATEYSLVSSLPAASTADIRHAS